MKIDELIQNITPKYNHYKVNSNHIKATDAIELMWDIGDLLLQYFKDHQIQPHGLYRLIYGKSEGTKNTYKKSYITREFLGRCYRIRKIFTNREEIREILPNLQRFTTFREAMPFFDNPKFVLTGEERKNLLKLLNDIDNRKAFIYIKNLQKSYIGISNPRTQRLTDLSEEKQVFITFYNHVFNLTKLDHFTRNKILTEGKITDKLRESLSYDISSLTEDGIKPSNYSYQEDVLIPEWSMFIRIIQGFKNQKNPKQIRRFRRIVPAMRMINLAEMLIQLDI